MPRGACRCDCRPNTLERGELALRPATSNESVTTSPAVNVAFLGLAPMVVLSIVHVTAGGAVLVIVTATVFASMHTPWSGRCMRYVGPSPGYNPMLAVPVVAAVIVMVMPGSQSHDDRPVPIMVMAIVRTDMRDPASVRDMPRPVSVVIVVERAIPQPTSAQHSRDR